MQPRTQLSTDRLLTLGMALYADKKTMEQRIHGIFARPRSATGALLASILLTATLGLACFTTACQPAREQADAPATEFVFCQTRRERREQIAPAVQTGAATRGSWAIEDAAPGAEDAIAAFLPVVNALFQTEYAPDDMRTAYYRDETGFRADLWRIESDDLGIVGALDADTLTLVSADSAIAPAKKPDADYATLDPYFETAAERTADALGGTVQELRLTGADAGASAPRGSGTADVLLTDGRVCQLGVYADANRTLYAVGVYPDGDCASESVYWRADLNNAEGVVQLVHPRYFLRGLPDRTDMPQEEARAFYERFMSAAAIPNRQTYDASAEPSMIFYVDHSGARDNYWHIEGEWYTIDLSSHTGQLLSAWSNTGFTASPVSDPVADAAGRRDDEAGAAALIAGLFGEENIERTYAQQGDGSASRGATVYMKDGTADQGSYEYGSIDRITLETTEGPHGATDPVWAADHVYVHNETGEIFHLDWFWD